MIDWGQVIIVLVTGGFSFATAWLVFRKGSGENKNKADEIKANLDKRIDDRVESQLSKAWARIDEQDIKIAMLEKAHRADTQRVAEVVDLAEEMVEHIEVIEELIPNPPGAPSRPDWLSRIKGLGLA